MSSYVDTSSEKVLPVFLRDMLSAPPRHGEGVHNWLFRVARHLHPHRSQDEIFQLLRAVTEDCGRPVPDSEIWNAVRNSEPVAWRPGDSHSNDYQHRKPSWPNVNIGLRAKIVQGELSLYDLWEQSPVRFEDREPHAEEVVPKLFPGNPLLCVGWEKTKAITASLSEFKGELVTLQFVVPNPMTKRVGWNQQGEESPRCLDNTGPRKYLVVEFDSGTLDDQAALLSHLAKTAPLAVVVFSGVKSLHGWFACHDQSEEALRNWMRGAVKLGADPANFTRCQFVRMPDGLRDNGKRQVIYYFNPGVVR